MFTVISSFDVLSEQPFLMMCMVLSFEGFGEML